MSAKDKDKIKQNIKDMTLEDLQIALEEQNIGLLNDLREIVLSQIDVIKEQQKEIIKNRDLISTLTNVVDKVNAQTQMIIEKQRDLEEFAMIGSGIKTVAETTVGRDKLIEEANKFVNAMEESESREDGEV